MSINAGIPVLPVQEKTGLLALLHRKNLEFRYERYSLGAGNAKQFVTTICPEKNNPRSVEKRGSFIS
jgi:hypothetical protein